MPIRAGKTHQTRHNSTDTESDDSETARVEVADDDDETVGDEEEDQAQDADAADDQEETESSSDEEQPRVIWTGYGKKIPVMVFRAEGANRSSPELRAIGEKYHLAFKIVKTECRLVRNLMTSHGFHEAHPNSNEFNLLWTGMHVQPYLLRSMLEHQKVNHFPRSYEITRKDRLYKNIQRMQQTKGFKHFDFLPPSFIVPGEFQDFCSAYIKDKGPWIVKPIASSRGRGIFLVNHPEQVPLDDTMIVCKYLNHPLLIDGFKFDLRLYVAVTSYDPLVIYMYEEGMTRFATVKFEKNIKNIKNTCMHLTNYSVNKKSNDYVKNDDPDVEDFGNKWTLGALLRYLRSENRDTTAMMMRVEDVIIKTLLSAENTVATACKMFMPFKGNCFEVYGFDILIDDNLRPWVLEVNLSPSLATDSPLDLKLKSNMLSDLFTLIGIVCHDPMIRKTPNKRSTDLINKVTRAQSKRPHSASSVKKSSSNTSNNASSNGPSINASGLTGEEIRMVRRAKEEYARRGGWIRIFPSPDSWELYSPFLQYASTNNLVLWQQLNPDRARHTSVKPSTASYSSAISRTKSVHLHSAAYPQLHISSQKALSLKQLKDDALSQALARSLQYERKLSSLGHRQRRNPTKRQRAILGAPCLNGHGSSGATKGALLAQGIEETESQSSSASTSTSHLPANVRPATKEETKLALEKQAASQENPTAPPKEGEKPLQLSEPKYEVVELLEHGKTMSKVQARFAFASYLDRVHERLMTETTTGGSVGNGENNTAAQQSDEYKAANEQMDLVLRFLKRAAGNLQQPFKVVVPSRKLPLNDRRRILAKQLGDFVRIYNKETEQLRQRNRLDEKHLRRPPSFSQNDGLDEARFNKFVALASENELEEVLTTYTKLNKSASIFLGSNSKSSHDGRSGTPSSMISSVSQQASGSGESGLSRRKNSMDSIYRQAQEHEGGSHTRSSSRSRLHSASSTSSYAGAVAAYSARLAGPSSAGSVRRPQSAAAGASASSSSQPGSGTNSRPTSGIQQSVSMLSGGGSAGNRGSGGGGGGGGGASRPMSATSPASMRPPHRERPDGAESEAALMAYDEDVINAALQKLTQRQQQRQYTSRNGAGQLLTNGIGGGEEITTASKPPAAPPRTAPGGGRGGPNETFNNFVSASNSDHHHGSSSQPHPHSSSNQYSSSHPHQNSHRSSQGSEFKPTFTSTQYHLQQHQQMLKQQRMMEQSKQLLEASKAKHQAMVAQAHAAVQQHTPHTPHPPPGGAPPPPDAARKHRAQQAAAAQAARSSTNAAHHSDSLAPATSQHTHVTPSAASNNFYNSLKYDSSKDFTSSNAGTGKSVTTKNMFHGRGGYDGGIGSGAGGGGGGATTSGRGEWGAEGEGSIPPPPPARPMVHRYRTRDEST